MAHMEEQIKAMAKENGAAMVGIGSRERLLKAPPSADTSYLLPSTRSIISFAIPIRREIIRDYLAKKNWLAFGAELKRIERQLYTIADQLADFLAERGYEAKVVDVNQVYRPEPGGTDALHRVAYVPDFSHRYGAVAAGLGWLGWSGNLLTYEYGATVLLDTVLTSAELETDLLVEPEDRCQNCKVCVTVCPVSFMNAKESVSVKIAGREYTYAKKGTNIRCVIGCGGYHGLGPSRRWSTWSPYRLDKPLPKDDDQFNALSLRIRAHDPDRQKYALYTERDYCFDAEATYTDSCGNCQLTCWEKLEDCKENQRILFNSGRAVLTAKGKRMVVSADETTELKTPFELMVAVNRQEQQAITCSRKEISGEQGFVHPLDEKVIQELSKLND